MRVIHDTRACCAVLQAQVSGCGNHFQHDRLWKEGGGVDLTIPESRVTASIRVTGGEVYGVLVSMYPANNLADVHCVPQILLVPR